jgi:hypothetical protein
MIETGARAEREISDNSDLDLLPQCMQIDSDTILRSEIIMSLRPNQLETSTSGFLLRKQKFQKTLRAPKEGSLKQSLCKKSARNSSRFKVF